MEKTYYTDGEHEIAYLELIESTGTTDAGIKALLYVLTAAPELRRRTHKFLDGTGHPQLNHIYDAYHYLSGGEQSMVRLALNLFSGECGGEGAPWSVADCAPYNIVRDLDVINLSACFQAIMICRGLC